jgi:hypothetical protein
MAAPASETVVTSKIHAVTLRKPIDVNIQCRKGEVHLITCHEDAEGGWRYSYTLSLTSALDGVGGQLHALAALARE